MFDTRFGAIHEEGKLILCDLQVSGCLPDNVRTTFDIFALFGVPSYVGTYIVCSGCVKFEICAIGELRKVRHPPAAGHTCTALFFIFPAHNINLGNSRHFSCLYES